MTTLAASIEFLPTDTPESTTFDFLEPVVRVFGTIPQFIVLFMLLTMICLFIAQRANKESVKIRRTFYGLTVVFVSLAIAAFGITVHLLQNLPQNGAALESNVKQIYDVESVTVENSDEWSKMIALEDADVEITRDGKTYSATVSQNPDTYEPTLFSDDKALDLEVWKK